VTGCKIVITGLNNNLNVQFLALTNIFVEKEFQVILALRYVYVSVAFLVMLLTN